MVDVCIMYLVCGGFVCVVSVVRAVGGKVERAGGGLCVRHHMDMTKITLLDG